MIGSGPAPRSTALDAPASALDADEQTFVAQVREHGWFCTHVHADDEGPGFSYSTGFWLTLGQPEVILFGIRRETAQAALWSLFRMLQAGRPLRAGVRDEDLFNDLPAWLEVVDPARYRDYLGWSGWFYGGADFPCLQLVWPDPAGRFPWQGMDPQYADLQPDLSVAGWGRAPA